MMLARCFAACLAVVAASVAPPARADWLDEMPDVATVAQVVDRLHGGAPEKQHQIAIDMAETLILLRQLLEYRAAEDAALTPAQRERMRQLADGYLLAELAIGRRPGARRGALTEAAVRQFYESRRHQPCATADCYQYWVRHQLEFWNAFNFRSRMLPLLFPCGSAPALLELAARHAMAAPLIPFTPSAPLPRDAPAIARLAAEQAKPAACTADGADVDGDGQCYGWEAGIALARTKPAGEACPVLTLESATTADAASITVRYTAGPGLAGRPIRLTACRATIQTLAKCEGPLSRVIGSETISAPEKLTPGWHEAVVLNGKALPPDTSMPYVIVIGDAAGQSSRTYFHKWTMGVVVHGYTFRRLIAVATAVDEEVGHDVRLWLLKDKPPQPWQQDMVQSLKSTACYDGASFPFEWQFSSTLELREALHDQAVRLYREIARRAMNMVYQHTGDVVDVHLIGHSRGTVIVSEVLKEWKAQRDIALVGSYVRVTLLDPHPANNRIRNQQDVYFPDDNLPIQALYGWIAGKYHETQSRVDDPLIELPGGIGIGQAEVWFQHTRVKDILAAPVHRDPDVEIAGFNLWGLGATTAGEIESRTDRSIDLRWRNLTNFQFDDGALVDHNGVFEYYQGEINRNAVAGKCVMPPR